jgi:hypothetical protein
LTSCVVSEAVAIDIVVLVRDSGFLNIARG